MKTGRVGVIGFGEAGREISHTLSETQKISLFAYDKLYQSDKACRKAEKGGAVRLCESAAELAAQADVIMSVVTADETLNAIHSLVPHIGPEHVIVDGNSVSPGTKKKAAQHVEKTGAAYIDMAIMAPIKPHGHRTQYF